MGDARNEPSMDHILASIKRIINDEGAAALSAGRARAQPAPPPESGPEPAADDVLELTEPLPEPAPVEDAPVEDAPEIVSADTASASRQSLAALSSVVVRKEPEPVGGNTLEALVRELLRPMLKDWLDAHLPELVEQLVSREIARITGKTL